MPGRVLVASVCVGLALGALAPAARAGDLERRRDDAHQRESQVRHQLDLAHASESDLSRHIADIATDLTRRQADAASAHADAEVAAARVVSVTADIAGLRQQLAQRRFAFNRRAVLAYMGGEGRPLDEFSVAGELLSPPADAAEAARETEIVRGVARQDDDALAALTATQHELAHKSAQLSAARDQVRRRAADAEAAVVAVAELKKEQEAAKAVLDQRIAGLTSEADALAAQQAQILELIRQRQAALAAARAAREAARRARDGVNFVGRLGGTVGGVSAQGFIWPVRGVLTSGFGPRWGRMHTGIDIAAPEGTPIHAARDGVVLYAGWIDGYGNTVVLDHGDNLVTLYGHQSRLGCREGEPLRQGDVLGFVGSTGHSTGNHLHFEVRVDGEPRNPRPYLP